MNCSQVLHESICSLERSPSHRVENARQGRLRQGTPFGRLFVDEVGGNQGGGGCLSSLHCDGHSCLIKCNFSKFL